MRTHEHVQLPFAGGGGIMGQHAGLGEVQPLGDSFPPASSSPLQALSSVMGLAQQQLGHGASGGGGSSGPLGALGMSQQDLAALVMAQAQHASALGAAGGMQLLAAMQAAAGNGYAHGQNGHLEPDEMEEDSDADREMRCDDDRWAAASGSPHGLGCAVLAHGGHPDAQGVFSRPKRLDKSEVKKAKRGVYIALREVSLSLRSPGGPIPVSGRKAVEIGLPPRLRGSPRPLRPGRSREACGNAARAARAARQRDD
jgi:hypothetical protein